jgi:hypothetical protein
MKNQRHSKISMAKNLVWSVVGVVLLAVTFGLYWSGAGNDLRFYLISAPVRQEDDIPRKLEALLKAEIQPVIRLYHDKNKAELITAISEMNRCFDKYESGINAFVEDMSSFGTRLGILGRQMGDWYDHLWGNKDPRRVADYVRNSFEKHVFSDIRIQQDIRGVLQSYGYALQANQNRMVSDIRNVVMHTDLPVNPARLELANYNDLMLQAYQGGFKGMGQQSALNMSESLVSDLFGGWVVCKYLPARYCIPIGVVWGLMVEWWAGDQIKTKLTAECTHMVLLVRQAVISDTSDGLERKLTANLQNLLKANLNTSETIIKERS